MSIVDGPRSTTSLRSRHVPLSAPKEQLRLLDGEGSGGVAPDFDRHLAAAGWPSLRPNRLEIFQINLGKLCNMTCRHCHVDAGPDRSDAVMDRATVDACLRAIDASGVHTVDLTGGAPELNPHFAYLVDACVERRIHVIDRCNLTILTTGPYRHLPGWLAERNVEVVCSLPHFRRTATDAQRGEGTYARSIDALRALNGAGYGKGDPLRRLVLVTNPVGAFLSGHQQSLEAEWKSALARHHDVTFDALYALNNMPIARFLEWLLERDMIEVYMERLVNAFNPATVAGLMCRNTISVSWDGRLFDCDFNQMLELEPELEAGSLSHVRDFSPDSWRNHRIRTAPHCFGCTAGAGSSCGGSINS